MFISAMRRPKHVDGFGVKTAETKTFTGVTTVMRQRKTEATSPTIFDLGVSHDIIIM